MIPIKIECPCGQHYAFDVEPVSGHMPTAVRCPACGADGTAAADTVIARRLAAQPTAPARPVGVLLSTPDPMPAPATPPPPVRVAVAAAPAAPAVAVAPRSTGPLGGAVDRTRAENEARAKIFWGDSPQEVTRFLMMQGLPHDEAAGWVRGMVQERAATIRRAGIGKVLLGGVLVPVPIIALIIFLRLGFIPLMPFAGTILVGLYGAWLLLKGGFMLLAPKSEGGDVADQ